jgi:hypothetical protein
MTPALRTIHELVMAGIAMRRVHARAAQDALARAEEAARWARIPALMAEVDQALMIFDAPAARLIAGNNARPLRLEDVETLFALPALVVDACRRSVRQSGRVIALARRPVLFALARALGEAWPDDVPREALVARAFRGKSADESHRARLRVEIGRLRRIVAPLAAIEATERGFVLRPHQGRSVAVLVPPIDGDEASLLALLADGAAWSTSALALALGESQRTVQRALVELEGEGRVRAIGRARAQRWLAPPLAGFTTILLLPAALPND